MAKSFFAKHNVPYTEKDVTTNPAYMEELKQIIGRFVTPVLVIDGEVFLGFGMNLPQIQRLLKERGYL